MPRYLTVLSSFLYPVEVGVCLEPSGTRVICTLIAALKFTGNRRSVPALCIGGGEATALALELL